MDVGFDQWLLRLAVAAVFAGLVGWQREVTQKQAGLRTHVLVGIGAALFTLAGIEGFENGDESRVAAQVVTGVGFLGAGAIFREGANIHGLTTAAGMWAVAAIGITAGAGIIDGALLATAIALFVLVALGWVERRAHERRMETAEPMRVKFAELDQISTALNMLERIDPDAMDLSLERQPDGTTVLSVPVAAEKRDLVETMMMACAGVVEAG
jgi:putative Mg2+ transporter-C (MgtC) family protein